MVDLSRHEAAFADAKTIEHAAREKQLCRAAVRERWMTRRCS